MQFWVRDSKVESHADTPEDMGRVLTVFQTVHQELRETKDITVQYVGIHPSNMVQDVVSGMQEVLQQDQSTTNNPPVISETNYHVANVVQITLYKLVEQL